MLKHKISDPAPVRTWSSHELEASQGLAGMFERRSLDEGAVEYTLESIVRAFGGPNFSDARQVLTWAPFCLDLCAVGLCLARPSQEPRFNVTQFSESPSGFGVVDWRRVSDVYREAVVLGLWCVRSGIEYGIVKRPEGVYVRVAGAGPEWVLFTEREES